jgi:tight adherence protein C
MKFMHAGWRNESAPGIYFAAKTVLVIGLPLVCLVTVGPYLANQQSHMLLMLLLLLAAIGYYLPNFALARRRRQRQQKIFEDFPDALDLLTVCVEAGLGLDAALMKVADEIHVKSQTLSDELQLLLLELRAGSSKETALKNLALRTGVEELDVLVAMLIQAERFGTSMGDSLRVHSENLRLKRRLKAEEAAGKIALKLLFPLMFCIFPTLMLVLLGPAFIQVLRVLLPTMAGTDGAAPL